MEVDMEGAQEFQDLYSSTSSDDQSSINSVVHVGAAADTSESDTSAPPTPRRQRFHHPQPEDDEEYDEQDDVEVGMDEEEEMEEVELDEDEIMNQVDLLEDDVSTTDSDDEEGMRRRRRDEEGRQDSDTSSTSSEETQIWVPVRSRPQSTNNNNASTPNGRGAPPSVPPKPAYRNSAPPVTMATCQGTNNNSTGAVGSKRNSYVSHNSATGRAETLLLSDDDHVQNLNNGDSGYSNESPENQSNNDGHNPHHYANYPLDSVPGGGPNHSSTPHSLTPSSGHSHHSTGSGNSRQHINPQAQANVESILRAHAVSISNPTYNFNGPRSPSQNSNHSHIVSLPLPTSISPTPSPMLSGDRERLHILTPGSEEQKRAAKLRESLFNILSALYAMLVNVLGLCLPLAEIFGHEVHPTVFESFYIYLYGVSILFLSYVYCFLLRNRTSNKKSRFGRRGKKSGRASQNLSKAEDIPLTTPSGRSVQKVSMSNQSHTGSFYLRLGAVGFGIGAMIHEGLMFGQHLEGKLDPECIHVASLIRPVVQLAFTFIQLYFIFLNSRMCIHKYRTFARFGLMHMIATNLCVWLRVIIHETMRDITMNMPGQGHNNVTSRSHHQGHVATNGDQVHGSHTNETVLNESLAMKCRKEEIMSEVVENASPYLYPCTIEYSLIAAGILYVMWHNIGRPPPPPTPDSPITSENALRKKHLHMSVDCSGANRGLFFGIFTLVGTIISLIVFFVLVDKPAFTSSAVMVVHISELVLYFLALVAVAIAFYKIRDMKFNAPMHDHLDEILLLVSLVGVFMYSVFSIVAGCHKWITHEIVGGGLVMGVNILVMIQAIVQTVFILNGLRRSPRTAHHETKRPGREFITFLLVCNIGMWGINTFEVLRSDSNPIAVIFYGFFPWSIITHISTPLAIFYRFHSTVCLSTIWKNAYKQKLM